MEFDEFIESAWEDHAEHAEDVASRLEDSVHLIETPAHVPPYVKLITHVYGEHLGRWRDGVELLESLRSVTSCDDNPACARAVTRAVATLRYASGDKRVLDRLSRDDRIIAVAGAASALAGQERFDDALSSYALATRLGSEGLADDSPATRALAIAGNNLAAALETKSDRSREQTEGMVSAAKDALHYWKRAGTWLEEERAHFRLSRSLLCAGDGDGAIASARECLAICGTHDAPAFEHFFAYAALAHAQLATGDRTAYASSREHALQYRSQIPASERASCDAELQKLPSQVSQ